VVRLPAASGLLTEAGSYHGLGTGETLQARRVDSASDDTPERYDGVRSHLALAVHDVLRPQCAQRHPDVRRDDAARQTTHCRSQGSSRFIQNPWTFSQSGNGMRAPLTAGFTGS
jgi:hypothetical protein